MLLVEYRICLPFTTQEYRRAQLYMIARHCEQESDNGEGVEVIKYETCEDSAHGVGHYTEKRIHLYKKLPVWMQSILPNMFYIEEKSWNYYPYTITEYTCSFIPKFHICVETKYEDNSGETNNAHNLSDEEIAQRTVDFIDIVKDSLPEHKYKESEDPRKIVVKKTNPNRGPLKEDWKTEFKQNNMPIMCSYKTVRSKFEVWGFQTKVEGWAQKAIRDILLLAHKQAFAWTDDWYDKTYEMIVEYERATYSKTNEKVLKDSHQNDNKNSDKNDHNILSDLNNHINKNEADFD